MTIQTITRTIDFVTKVESGTSAAVVKEPQAEFDRFEELARGLVRVPKRELDEKREQG